MKIRVVSSKDEIVSLDNNEEIVHLAFRPSNKDIFELVQKCSNLKAIHIPSSYKKTISTSTQMFLEMQNVALLEGDVWGHRKDINEYYEIKPQIFDRIEDLKSEGQSSEEILTRLGMETRLSKDLIKFLI
jgi:hypothetical protein